MRHVYSSLILLAAAFFLGACGTSGTGSGAIPLYVIVLPALLAVLAALGVVLAVLRTNRGRVSTGREGMIGEVGVVRRPVAGNSAGMVFVHGELWQAFPEDPDGAPLETGSEVEVVGFHRSAVIVRPTERA